MKTADFSLVELAGEELAKIKKVHDEVDEWLEKNWGGEERAEAHKSISSRTQMVLLHPDRLETFASSFSLPQSMHQESREAIRQSLKLIALSDVYSDTYHKIDMSDQPGGTRYLEKFMIRHQKQSDGQIAIVLSYFSDMRTLNSNWMWLVNNHETERVMQWLDYKLYSGIKKKATSLLSSSGSYLQLESPTSLIQLLNEVQAAAATEDDAKLRAAIDGAKAGGVAITELQKYEAILLDKLEQVQADKKRSENKRKVLQKLETSRENGNDEALQQALDEAEGLGLDHGPLNAYRRELEKRQEVRSNGRRAQKAKEDLHEALGSRDEFKFREAVQFAKQLGLLEDAQKAEKSWAQSREKHDRQAEAEKNLREAAGPQSDASFGEILRAAEENGVQVPPSLVEELEVEDIRNRRKDRQTKEKEIRKQALREALRKGASRSEFQRAYNRAEEAGVNPAFLKECLEESFETIPPDQWEEVDGRHMLCAVVCIVVALQCMPCRQRGETTSGQHAAAQLRDYPEGTDDNVSPDESVSLVGASACSRDSMLSTWSIACDGVQCFLRNAQIRWRGEDGTDRIVQVGQLQPGCKVVAADGDLTQLISMNLSPTETLVRLYADGACLEVTPNHRIVVPKVAPTSPATVPAKLLEGGSDVICSDGTRKLTRVEKINLDIPQDAVDLVFKPDKPIAVFPAHAILSKG